MMGGGGGGVRDSFAGGLYVLGENRRTLEG